MREYFHSVVLDKDSCRGCTNCMQRCPTEAIRIRDKKAVIINERCIDCGECINVCPYHAQNAITDDLSKLNKYNFNIAITPMSLHGQFISDTNMDKIFSGIKKLGFDCVYDEALGADLATSIIKNVIKNEEISKPVISSHCPAVVRLIQTMFPSLMQNIIKIETPMEIAARVAKTNVANQKGINPNKIGVFYLTPCPAKVTSIRQPIGIKRSYLNGAISVKKIYGDIVRNAKKVKKIEKFEKASSSGIGWSRVGGQSNAIGVHNYVAVDGIENVIKVLEEIELGKIDDIDYFEGLACKGGCVGGPLNVENPFVAKSRIRKISEKNQVFADIDEDEAMNLCDSGFVCWTEKLYSKEVLKLDKDMLKAMSKMEQIQKIQKTLPGLDCGSCGAPSCRALAEDIVKGNAVIDDCIFKANEEK